MKTQFCSSKKELAVFFFELIKMAQKVLASQHLFKKINFSIIESESDPYSYISLKGDMLSK